MKRLPQKPSRLSMLCRLFALVLAAGASGIQPARAEAFRSPDILVLGDSQLSFGTGPVLLDFLQMLGQQCRPFARSAAELAMFEGRGVGVIGVRSSSLQAWTSRKKQGKSAICNVDPKWKVNAGAYGVVNRSGDQFVQIGQGASFQFCRAGISPFEAMFQDGYYKPKLLILHFLGNSEHRWAESAQDALSDVRATVDQLPKGLPCVFMTTAPAYDEKTLKLRLRAQANVEKAFAATGQRCSFVPGQTTATIKANLGNRAHFRQKPSGAVKDGFHPNSKAAKKFLEIERESLCRAILDQAAR